MPYDLSDLMQVVCAEREEAVHLHDKEAPVLEIKRMLHRIEGPPVAPGETEQLLRTVALPEDLSELRTNRISSFYFHFRDVAVFHIMAFHEDGSVRLESRRFK
jgi:hypothetical protein